MLPLSRQCFFFFTVYFRGSISESSCVTCIRIKKWPSIDGEERDNPKEETLEQEQDKYKAFDRDTDNTRRSSTELNCDRTDVPDDSRKKYGSR